MWAWHGAAPVGGSSAAPGAVARDREAEPALGSAHFSFLYIPFLFLFFNHLTQERDEKESGQMSKMEEEV